MDASFFLSQQINQTQVYPVNFTTSGPSNITGNFTGLNPNTVYRVSAIARYQTVTVGNMTRDNITEMSSYTTLTEGTPSSTHSLIHSPTHSLTYSLTHPLTHSSTHSPTHSLTHTHSSTHSLIHSPTHLSVITAGIPDSPTNLVLDDSNFLTWDAPDGNGQEITFYYIIYR